MKVKIWITLTIVMALGLAAATAADSSKSLLKELGLPEFPGAKLLTEGSLPEGELLDTILKVYGPQLGLSDVMRVSNVTYAIDPATEAHRVFKFYEPSITKQGWKTISRDFSENSLTAILFNEKKGLLYMNVNRPGAGDRELTLMRVFGKVDPSKAASPTQRPLAEISAPDSGPADHTELFGVQAGIYQQAASRIPTGQPIAIPPSQKLHIRAARSEIRARVLGQNTAEVRLASRAADPGELMRIGERLVLTLTPKLAVQEIILPGPVALLLELTEGSLTLSCGPGPDDRPTRLSVVATGAPVTLELLPLISGTHIVKSIGGEVRIVFSTVQGGILDVEVTGKDLTAALPRDASATLRVSAPSGKIENLTGLQPQELTADRIRLQMGAGKADISLRAINGTVCIKYAD